MARVLIIEDDALFARRLARNLGLEDFEAETAEGPDDGLARLAAEAWDAVICDIRMPGMSGLELLDAVRSGARPGIDPDMPVIMLTSVTSVETAVDAMQRGASDYLTKEAGRQEVVVRLRRALGQRQVIEENRRLRAAVAKTDEFSELVGESDAIRRIKDDIAEVAETTATVMIMGETGSGKELVARAIHRASGRAGDFVDINGALLPDDTMLQSELFGHEKGAFTDARAQRKGKLELADRGTLFLDEVGEISRDVQAKLLRVLETMTFTRVGGTRPLKTDVRVVAATNRELLEDVRAGNFRDDLYYRLNVFPIEIPPLRKRPEDIEPLARFFLERTAERYGRPVPELTPEALDVLRASRWPGNIRELRNVCERLVIRARRGGELTATDVRSCGIGEPADLSRIVTIPEDGLNMDELEKDLVLEALRRCDWNQTDAARLLGISTDRMNNRVRKFGFTHPKWRRNR